MLLNCLSLQQRPRLNAENLEDKAHGEKDLWDKLASLTTLITSLIIGGAVVIATYLYNRGQLRLKKQELEGDKELKEREEKRYSKIDLAEALDKYAHYMFSADPQQREFGYNLFTQLGFPELALQLGRTAADQAVKRVAESQITSGDATIRGEAAQTLAVLTLDQKITIRNLIMTIEGRYDYVKTTSSDIEFGVFGWSFIRGDLEQLVLMYVSKSNASYVSDIKPFIDRIKQKDKTLIADTAFQIVLKNVSGDVVMHYVENYFVDVSLDTTLALIKPLALRLPLSIAIAHDARINLGDTGLRRLSDRSTQALEGSPAQGVCEKKWVNQFLDFRKDFANKMHLNMAGVQNRIRLYMDLVARDDWDLQHLAAATVSTSSKA